MPLNVAMNKRLFAVRSNPLPTYRTNDSEDDYIMTINSRLRIFASIALIFAAFVSLNAQTEREVAEAVVQGLKLFEQQ